MTNNLPFQFLQRAAYIERLQGMMRTAVLEQRDRELEDYLGTLTTGGGGGEPGPAGPPGAVGPAGATGATGAPGVGVPTGGTVQQVLGKTSGADYATSWRDPTWLVVKATEPTAADYGLGTIPVGAVWIVSP